MTVYDRYFGIIDGAMIEQALVNCLTLRHEDCTFCTMEATPIAIAMIETTLHAPDGVEEKIPSRVLISRSEGIVHAHDLDTNQLGTGETSEQAMLELRENVEWFFNECSRDPDNTLVVSASRELIDLWEKLRRETMEQKAKPKPWSQWKEEHLSSREYVAV